MNAVCSVAIHSTDFVIKVATNPTVIETTQNISGCIIFIFGLGELIDAYNSYRGLENHTVTTLTEKKETTLYDVANKVIQVCGRLSLILSAAVTTPGVFVISKLVGCVFSTPQLERAFGPYASFAVNPWHPRNVATIAALILGVPANIQTVYYGGRWAYRKVTGYQDLNQVASQPGQGLLHDAARRVALFFDQWIIRFCNLFASAPPQIPHIAQ